MLGAADGYDVGYADSPFRWPEPTTLLIRERHTHAAVDFAAASRPAHDSLMPPLLMTFSARLSNFSRCNSQNLPARRTIDRSAPACRIVDMIAELRLRQLAETDSHHHTATRYDDDSDYKFWRTPGVAPRHTGGAVISDSRSGCARRKCYTDQVARRRSGADGI
jgi:hypothetical protein